MKAMKSGDRKLERETAIDYQGRALVVALHPGYMTLRRKGTRDEPVMLNYAAAYELAIKAAQRDK